MDTENKTPVEFWEDRYSKSTDRKRGRVGKLLQAKVASLKAGTVLELGCSNGDDSLWLAENGWQVTALDISQTAISTGERLSKEEGLADKIKFLCRDLSNEELPDQSFDLVVALFFQSPYEDFPRIEILKKAAAKVKSDGHLLIVTHATAPPWAPKDAQKRSMPVLKEDWEGLALNEDHWEIINLSVEKRIAKSPEGEEAELEDNLIFLRRK